MKLLKETVGAIVPRTRSPAPPRGRAWSDLRCRTGRWDAWWTSRRNWPG